MADIVALTDAQKIEALVVQGDLSKLTPEQRMVHYRTLCESLGLNWQSQPFAYLSLSGKLVLYARKDATDQLRKINKVSVRITAKERIADLYVVTAQASTPDGRVDEETGAVSVGNLKGDALANAIMKATTKAKRRVTLSICGLGFTDETEVETIREAKIVPPDVTTNQN